MIFAGRHWPQFKAPPDFHWLLLAPVSRQVADHRETQGDVKYKADGYTASWAGPLDTNLPTFEGKGRKPGKANT